MEGRAQTDISSSRINTFLSQMSDTPDVVIALLKALTRHVHLKTENLKHRIREFESKWNMTFEEFSERTRTGKLPAGDVELDFRAWEQTEMLLKHYRSLQTR